MKSILQIAFYLMVSLLLSSCHNTKNKLNSEPDNADAISTDTLMYNGQVVYLEPIDSIEFLKLPPLTEKIDSIERIDDAVNVYRYDSILILKLDNGDSVKVVSTPSLLKTGESDIVIHRYLKEDTSLYSYLISNAYYEGGDYSLFNKHNGKETVLFGIPLMSKDNKMVLACAVSLSGESTTGIQLFSIDNDHNLISKWAWTNEYSQSTYFGPKECRWKDNNTIYIRSMYMDSSFAVKTKFLKLKLPDFTK